MIDSMNGGGFLSFTGEEAYRSLDQLSDSSQQWDFLSRRYKFSPAPKKGGLYEVKDEVDIRWQLNDLTHKVEAIALSKLVNSANVHQVEGCSLCASPMHLAQKLPVFVHIC